MNSLRCLLVICGTLPLAVVYACTCEPMDFKEAYCDDDLDVAVVAVRLSAWREKHTSDSDTHGIPNTDTHGDSEATGTTIVPSTAMTTTSAEWTGRTIEVEATVTRVYRQGTDVTVTKGAGLTLRSTVLCGDGNTLMYGAGKEYILKMPRSGSGKHVWMCDLFVNRYSHNVLGNPDSYFKRLGNCKKKKNGGKDRKGKDRKGKGRKGKDRNEKIVKKMIKNFK